MHIFCGSGVPTSPAIVVWGVPAWCYGCCGACRRMTRVLAQTRRCVSEASKVAVSARGAGRGCATAAACGLPCLEKIGYTNYIAIDRLFMLQVCSSIP
jgi:hypothetical protein